MLICVLRTDGLALLVITKKSSIPCAYAKFALLASKPIRRECVNRDNDRLPVYEKFMSKGSTLRECMGLTVLLKLVISFSHASKLSEAIRYTQVKKHSARVVPLLICATRHFNERGLPTENQASETNPLRA